MSVPKTVTKINKKGVSYKSDVDKAQYCIHELCRGALRDVGKMIKYEFRSSYYSHFKRRTGASGKITKGQVIAGPKTTAPRLEIGLPHASKSKTVDGYYAYFQELGSSKTPKLGLLQHAVEDNVPKIIEIESKYLSALESEAKALSMIDEGDYEI